MKNILGVDVIESINDFLHDSETSNAFYTWQSEKACDFINEPDRAARCHEAAAEGCDGSYTYEVIDDFREFGQMLLKEAWQLIDNELQQQDTDEIEFHIAAADVQELFEECERAFEADVVRCEEWHIKNGTYEQQGS